MIFFSKEEFECDGVNCFDKMDKDLLQKLDIARSFANIPFKITSSWRSEEHNEKVGGSKNSSHLRGYAVDIYCKHSVDRLLMLEALTSAGFTRIGVAKTFIHVDVDPELPNGVMWLY